MPLRLPRVFASAVLALAFVSIGCGDSGPSAPPPPAAEPVADFSAPDVNATSPRFGDAVSPRDYLGQVSAWYFGHAT